MATRSVIALATDIGVQAIYCQWDGYVACNGRILDQCYQDRASVEQLMELGDLSALNDTPDECEAYHRDRNEPRDMTRARTYANYQEMLVGEFEDSDREYVYVYGRNNAWSVIARRTQETVGAQTLSNAIAEFNREQMFAV